MNAAKGKVIKADQVKMEGDFRLDIGQPAPAAPPAAARPAAAVPQVCIVENNPEFAVLEVT